MFIECLRYPLFSYIRNIYIDWNLDRKKPAAINSRTPCNRKSTQDPLEFLKLKKNFLYFQLCHIAVADIVQKIMKSQSFQGNFTSFPFIHNTNTNSILNQNLMYLNKF